MPRNYTKKGKCYNEDLNKALEEVQDCISKNLPYSERAIARKYNIQKDVFNRRLKGLNTGVAGRKTAIPLAEEEELAESLKTMSRWGFGLLKEEIKNVVHEYVIKHNIKTAFKNNRPGVDWFLAFKERHNLAVKKPESLEVTRRNVTSDPFIIYDLYKQCESEINRLNLKSKPAQIYNLDESGFCTDPSKTKVVTEKGKPAHRTIQGSGRENTTVLACVNAAGKALPPLIVYEANKFWSSWVGNESQGMIKGTFLAYPQLDG